MKTTERNEAALPTGYWLTKERHRLGKKWIDVATAIHGHFSTVRAVEKNNRVVPPGWYPDLRKLGMQLDEPLWPAQMQPYCGADLQNDLRTRAGFRHSRYWLSKQLCVPERIVTDIIRDNLPVPHCWLLKLAELGANVPTPVQRTFDRDVYGGHILRPAAPCAANPEDAAVPDSLDAFWKQLAQERKTALRAFKVQAPKVPNSKPKESFGPARPEPPSPSDALGLNTHRASANVSGRASEQREISSLLMHWTEDRGLHFSVSAALLAQLPIVLQEMLRRLAQSGLTAILPDPDSSAART